VVVVKIAIWRMLKNLKPSTTIVKELYSVNELENGIYHAMNKGSKIAKGGDLNI
jgi:hypothetical protein